LQTFRLGECRVDLMDGYTRTRFADGRRCIAEHREQPGQRELAASLGYTSAAEMNRRHDLAHTVLSTWLGLPHSPTLRGVADGNFWPHHKLEEAAVLAVQAFAVAAGVDLLRVAAAHSREE
jgi:hypothetical protein